MVGYASIGVFGILVILAAFLRPKLLLFFYPLSLPFFGVIAEVGVQITPVLVVSLGMLISVAISGGQRLVFPRILLPYFTYVLLLSICMSFLLPEEVQHYPVLRGELRWVSQIFVFFMLFTPVIYFFNKRPSVKEIIMVGTIFIWAVVFLCLTGLFQLYMYNTTGKDIFPINLFSQITEKEDLRSALSRISGNLKVFRICGLGGGEPKHFGYSCVIAFNIHLLNWIFRGYSVVRNKFINLGIACLFVVCIILTLSTQSYLLLALDTVLLIGIMVYIFGVKSKRVIFAFLFLSIGTFMIIKNNYSRKLIEARIYERLEETGAVEDFNVTILDFLKDNKQFILFGTGLGNVHFWAFKYIPTEAKTYMTNNVFVAKAGALRIVSEQGLIGFILFVGILAFLMIRLWKARNDLDYSMGYICFCFLLIVIMNYFVSSDSSPYYIFAILLSLSILLHKSVKFI